MDLSLIYQDLSEEQRDEIDAMPRAERIAQMAILQGKATRTKVIEVAEIADIPYLEDIDPVDNPAAVIPLRLINEYQCIPVKTPAEEATGTISMNARCSMPHPEPRRRRPTGAADAADTDPTAPHPTGHPLATR